jgi:hypothetical protein
MGIFSFVFLPGYIIRSIGVLANLMLLIALIKDPLKCFRNSGTYLVGNLAFSDMLFSLVLLVNLLKPDEKIGNCLQFFAFYSSMITIFSIALDRFLMVNYPFKHRFLMSGKKMMLWIAGIWCISAVHPIKLFLWPNKGDKPVKSSIGAILIIITGVIYCKMYFVLKKQQKSMAGKKNTLPSSQSGRTSQKGSSLENESCVSDLVERAQSPNERAQSPNERAQSLNERAQSPNERAQSPNERAQSPNERAQNPNERAQSLNERAQSPNERAQSPNKRAQGLDERAEDENDRVESQNHRAENPPEHAQGQNERAQSPDERAQNQNDRVESQDERVPNQDKRAQTPHQSPQRVNNAKEQRFLNTIIIIALIAVVTTLQGTIYVQISSIFEDPKTRESEVPDAIVYAIFCLNFAVNPFIYYFRLGRYRETFKIVYCCKS